MARILYQQFVEPTFTLPEQVLLDKYYVQPSEPTRSKKRIDPYSRVSGHTIFSVPIPIGGDFDPKDGFPWQQTSEPVRSRLAPAREGWSAFRQTGPFELVLLDKWYAQPSEPVRFLPRPVREGWSVWQISTLPEQVLLDKYYVQPSEPLRSRPQPVREGWTAFRQADRFGEIVLLDRWYTQPGEPVRARLQPAREGWSSWQISTLAELVLLDRWYTQPSEPVRFLPRPVREGRSVWQLSVESELILVEKWYVQPSEPVRSRPRPAPEGWSAWQLSADHELVLLDKWYVQPSEPVRKKRIDPFSMATGHTVTPVAIIIGGFNPGDGFPWIQPSEPVRSRPVPVREGWISLRQTEPFGEVVLVEKWFVQPPEPVRRVPRGDPGLAVLPFQFVTPFDPGTGMPWVQSPDVVRLRPTPVREGWFAWQINTTSELVTQDKWYVQPSEPVRGRQGVVREGRMGYFAWQVSLLPELILLDKWYTQPSEPVRSRPRPVHEGKSVWQLSTESELVLVDKWYVQPSEPVRTRPAPVREGWVAWQLSTAHELILVDKWFVRPSEPVRSRRAPVREGWSVLRQATTFGEIILLDKWYVQPSEPVRFRPRPVREGWSVSRKIEPFGEIVLLDKWYVQPSEPVRFRPRPVWGHAVVPTAIAFDPNAGFPWEQPPTAPPRRLGPAIGYSVGPLEPTLWTAPPALSWYVQPSLPAMPRRRTPGAEAMVEVFRWFREVAAAPLQPPFGGEVAPPARRVEVVSAEDSTGG